MAKVKRQRSSSTTTPKSVKPSKRGASQPSRSKSIGKRIVAAIHSKADIFEQRNKIYGDNFLHFGKVMTGMFPRGLLLMTEADFNRFCILVQVASKMTRYGQAFLRGHRDSLDDTAVYAQMLAEYDHLVGLK